MNYPNKMQFRLARLLKKMQFYMPFLLCVRVRRTLKQCLGALDSSIWGSRFAASAGDALNLLEVFIEVEYDCVRS
jgi:hypothetical protein